MKASVETIEPKLYAGAVADEIISVLSEAIDERGSASLVLSGGTSPSSVYRVLSHPPRVSSLDWSRVKIFFGDERWVPIDDDQSNFRLAQETLLSQLPGAGAEVVAVNTSLASPNAGAEDYERRIQQTLGITAPTLPTFDLVLLGLGEDGHTASLFPGSNVLHERAKLCLAVEHNQQARITMTAPVFENARSVIFIVTGESKAGAVKRVLHGTDAAQNIPSRIFLDFRGRITWFLDSAAAHEL